MFLDFVSSNSVLDQNEYKLVCMRASIKSGSFIPKYSEYNFDFNNRMKRKKLFII